MKGLIIELSKKATGKKSDLVSSNENSLNEDDFSQEDNIVEKKKNCTIPKPFNLIGPKPK